MFKVMLLQPRLSLTLETQRATHWPRSKCVWPTGPGSQPCFPLITEPQLLLPLLDRRS